MARIAIIGGGWGARVQEPTFREAGLDVVLAGREEWRKVIAAEETDLVSIVTPPSEHLEMAEAALDAGKHVLCEKPTALNAGEAAQLVDAANRHPDRITLIDHELRFLPSWREARQRMASDIGPVRYAEVRYSSPARGERSRAWNWWSDAGRGGGIWGAVGSHFVDALRYFGLEPEAVQATLFTLIEQRPLEERMREVTADDSGAGGGSVAQSSTAGLPSASETHSPSSGQPAPSVGPFPSRRRVSGLRLGRQAHQDITSNRVPHVPTDSPPVALQPTFGGHNSPRTSFRKTRKSCSASSDCM